MTAEASKRAYEYFREFISQQTGIELGPDRQYLVESRLQQIVAEFGCRSMSELSKVLIRENEASRKSNSSHLEQRIIHALSTHETSFFRDADFFAALHDQIIPQWRATNPGRPYQVWSAAASSGQEAYSLAILCAEMGLDPPVEILATDISAIVIEAAARGHYSHYELRRGMDDVMLRKRYFIPTPTGAAIHPAIRNRIRFECQDLRSASIQPAQFDLILCRNVLIYFEADTRQQVLTHLHGMLSPGGVLILGATESIWGQIPGLHPVNDERTSYYVKQY